MIALGMLLWSVVGFWVATEDFAYNWTARIKPRWLGWLLMRIIEGPAWLAADMLWRWVDRPRPDRD